MNKKKLKSQMALSQCDDFLKLSKKTGINYRTLIDKVNNKRPINSNEIVKICDAIGLTDAEVKCDIFLD